MARNRNRTDNNLLQVSRFTNLTIPTIKLMIYT